VEGGPTKLRKSYLETFSENDYDLSQPWLGY
jgi:hypothetical protein